MVGGLSHPWEPQFTQHHPGELQPLTFLSHFWGCQLTQKPTRAWVRSSVTSQKETEAWGWGPCL